MSMRRSKRSLAENGEEKPKISRERLKNALKIFQYVLPYRWAFIVGMILLSLGSLLFLGIMWLPGEMVNIMSGESAYDATVNQVFLLIISLLLVQGILSYLRVRIFAYVSEKSMANLRQDLYSKMISLGIPFLEERRVGELTSRMTTDVAQVQGIVSVTLAEFLRQLIVLVGGIALIIGMMPRLTMIMLLTFPVVIVIAMIFGRYIRRLSRERQDQLAKTNVVVEETMQNIQTVKAYTNEWFEVQRYLTNLKEAVRISLKAAHFRGLFASFVILAIFGSLFFILWQAVLLVQTGNLATGDLINFLVYTGIIGGSIASIGGFYTEIVSAVGATERIFAILGESSELPLEQRQPSATRYRGDIALRDVHFAYPTRKDVPVLKGIDMEITSGQKVALVGASGAGKSTIMQLLLQFYRVDEGDILVDGQSIYDNDLYEYRQNIAIVPQEVLLFGGTIGENIRYGQPGATDQEVQEAAEKANAWDFISSFPEGLDTVVGERGVKLSGGQRQRVAIARAILKDPAILLLDEATSSLDAESERLVQEALNVLMVGRTSIIIAHRLSTIRDVDQIYVLEQGQIVEQGTHEELSAVEDGAYNALAKLQFESVS